MICCMRAAFFWASTLSSMTIVLRTLSCRVGCARAWLKMLTVIGITPFKPSYTQCNQFQFYESAGYKQYGCTILLLVLKRRKMQLYTVSFSSKSDLSGRAWYNRGSTFNRVVCEEKKKYWAMNVGAHTCSNGTESGEVIIMRATAAQTLSLSAASSKLKRGTKCCKISW